MPSIALYVDQKERVKGATYILLILGGAPLVAYPGVLLAGIMSLAGERTGNESFLLTIVSMAFLIASLVHPGVYLFSWAGALRASKSDDRGNELKFALLPIIYILLLGLLFMLWYSLEV